MEKTGSLNKIMAIGTAAVIALVAGCDASKASQLEEERGRVRADILMGLGLHEEGVRIAGPETTSAVACGEGDDERAAYDAALAKAHAFVREAMGLQEKGLSYFNEEVGKGAVGKAAISCVESMAHPSSAQTQAPVETEPPGIYEGGRGGGGNTTLEF